VGLHSVPTLYLSLGFFFLLNLLVQRLTSLNIFEIMHYEGSRIFIHKRWALYSLILLLLLYFVESFFHHLETLYPQYFHPTPCLQEEISSHAWPLLLPGLDQFSFSSYLLVICEAFQHSFWGDQDNLHNMNSQLRTLFLLHNNLGTFLGCSTSMWRTLRLCTPFIYYLSVVSTCFICVKHSLNISN